MPVRALRLALITATLGTPAQAADTGLFSGKVAPLLQKRCLSCHDGQKKRGGLDLSTRAGLLAGGETGAAVTVGKSAQSLLIHKVSGPTPRMPKQGTKLTAAEVETLARWIDTGAPWPQGMRLTAEEWWSLRPLARPPLPHVRETDWVQNGVDAFILAGLESRGLTSSPQTDRLTLIRRVTFDLHGLPPTPEEIDAFVQDMDPRAYERLIDRLLASPRYGERWGRHWLDVVHYGDTHGYDKDKRRDFAWRYRDYVIAAFNDDKPYSRFIQEQIAGDVLYPGDPRGVIATGFVTAGPWDFVGHRELREGTVDKEKTRVLDRDDMVSNTIATFDSLTVHCARCHDHKFDPIPQKDYYRLQAVFAGVERGDRAYFSPQRLAELQRVRAARERAASALAELRRRVAENTTPEILWLDLRLRRQREELAALPGVSAEPSPSNGYHSGIEPKPDVTKWVQIDLGRRLPLDAIRLIPARPTDFPDTPGFGFPQRFRVEVSDLPDFRGAAVVADHTAADFTPPGDVPVVLRPQGVSGRFVRVTATRLWRRTGDYVFALAEVQIDSGGKNVARGAKVTALDSIEAGRWSTRNLVDGFDSRHLLPDLAAPGGANVLQQRQELEAAIRQGEQSRQALLDAITPPPLKAELTRAEAHFAAMDRAMATLAAGDKVYAVLPIPPRPIWVLHRGNVEQHRDLVTPGGLACVRGPDPDFKVDDPRNEGARRAALARWIADHRNPLTWRSIANRIWQYHFGRGLVDTPNDFGRNGALPTHPELLDWLAVEFRDGGGSFKKMHKLILLSSTYRQASGHRRECAAVDADNRFVWRMNRQRLDAEEVRDSVLAVSGKLNLAMGGPGFELFRFKDDHSPVYDHTALEKIHDPATYRRTVYRFTVRSVPNPFLDCLDCADPNINTPVRNTTLTALQALALLNDPFMIRQAEYFAERVKGLSSDDGGQIEAAYRLALGRAPRSEERAALADYARKHGLVAACRLVLNVNEFVFID
jgi:hypothetical protein